VIFRSSAPGSGVVFAEAPTVDQCSIHVHCTLYTVGCTMYSVQWILPSQGLSSVGFDRGDRRAGWRSRSSDLRQLVILAAFMAQTNWSMSPQEGRDRTNYETHSPLSGTCAPSWLPREHAPHSPGNLAAIPQMLSQLSTWLSSCSKKYLTN
jgi:hypothetical protein